MTPQFAVLGISGGELVVILLVLIAGAVFLAGGVALLYVLLSRNKNTAPKVCPHCGKALTN